MARKTFNEKLHNAGELPKIEDLSGKTQSIARFGGNKLLIAAPMQYNDLMAKVPEGMVITTDKLREYLAEEAGASATCPLTAGIFINICAHTSVERKINMIPYWRTVKRNGELNEKYPGGIDGQKLLLETEGHEIVQKGKRWFVKDYERTLWEIE